MNSETYTGASERGSEMNNHRTDTYTGASERVSVCGRGHEARNGAGIEEESVTVCHHTETYTGASERVSVCGIGDQARSLAGMQEQIASVCAQVDGVTELGIDSDSVDVHGEAVLGENGVNPNDMDLVMDAEYSGTDPDTVKLVNGPEISVLLQQTKDISVHYYFFFFLSTSLSIALFLALSFSLYCFLFHLMCLASTPAY